MAERHSNTGKPEIIVIPRQDSIQTHRSIPRWLKIIGKLVEAWELWEQLCFVLILLALVGFALFRGWLSLHN